MKRGECGVWTEGPAERLLELWAEGLTAEQCARRISKQFDITVSRNAVVGRLHRCHLPPRSQREEQKRTRVYASSGPKPEPPPEPEPEPMPEPTPVVPVRLIDAMPRQCRFPMWGDEDRPSDFLVCGAQTVEDTSWCKAHVKKIFAPQPKRRDAA